MTIPTTIETENRVVQVARDILSGALGVIAGARGLAKLSFELGADRDPDFSFFIGVDSQTDHLPLGEVRRHWSVDALRQKDEELGRFEELFRDETFRVCRSLIEKYDKTAA